jgi:uncharacterized membrane protein
MKKIIYTLAVIGLAILPNFVLAQETGDILSEDMDNNNLELQTENIASDENLDSTQDPQYTEPDGFYRAQVQAVDTKEGELLGRKLITQNLTLKILDKDKKGEIIAVENGGGTDLQESQIYKKGDVLVVVKTKVADKEQYYIQDRYRLPGLFGMVFVFLVLTLIFTGKQGVGSMLG